MLIEANGFLRRVSNRTTYARKAMEKVIDRELLDEEVVHHIDRNKTNNGLDNLVILSKEEHIRIHKSYNKRRRLKEKPMLPQKIKEKPVKPFITIKCNLCGKEHKKYNINYIKARKQKDFYCSVSCYKKYIQENKVRLTSKEAESVNKGLKEGLTKYAIAQKYGIEKWKIYRFPV